jgi:hypothetical protein
MNCTAVGVDIAKNVFQVHYVDQATAPGRRDEAMWKK